MSLLVPSLNLRLAAIQGQATGTIADHSRPSTGPAAESTLAAGWAVEVNGLNRRYGSSRVLADVSLQIPWDQRIAVLGPNGAGKTTLLRTIATLARPSSGSVVVGGLKLPEQAVAIRRHIGFVAHQTFLYDDLTVRENLQFFGKLYGVSDLAARIEQVLGPLDMQHRANDRVRTLSRGLQQRTALARAILHDPQILLLDEPDTGLDVAGAEVLQHLLLDADGRRRTVLLTSHNLGRTIELVDRIMVIVRGRIALDVPSSGTSISDLEAVIRGERGA